MSSSHASGQTRPVRATTASRAAMFGWSVASSSLALLANRASAVRTLVLHWPSTSPALQPARLSAVCRLRVRASRSRDAPELGRLLRRASSSAGLASFRAAIRRRSSSMRFAWHRLQRCGPPRRRRRQLVFVAAPRRTQPGGGPPLPLPRAASAHRCRPGAARLPPPRPAVPRRSPPAGGRRPRLLRYLGVASASAGRHCAVRRRRCGRRRHWTCAGSAGCQRVNSYPP